MRRKKIMILRREEPEYFNGKVWKYNTIEFEVQVMSIVEKYAMVRRKGCMPFVIGIKNLIERRKDEIK